MASIQDESTGREPVVDVKLAVGMLQVLVDRSGRDAQLSADDAGIEAPSREGQNQLLSLGQLTDRERHVLLCHGGPMSDDDGEDPHQPAAQGSIEGREALIQPPENEHIAPIPPGWCVHRKHQLMVSAPLGPHQRAQVVPLLLGHQIGDRERVCGCLGDEMLDARMQPGRHLRRGVGERQPGPDICRADQNRRGLSATHVLVVAGGVRPDARLQGRQHQRQVGRSRPARTARQSRHRAQRPKRGPRPCRRTCPSTHVAYIHHASAAIACTSSSNRTRTARIETARTLPVQIDSTMWLGDEPPCPASGPRRPSGQMYRGRNRRCQSHPNQNSP